MSTSSDQQLRPPPGITDAPAPWTCKCSAYWILLSLPSNALPEDAYAPLEAASSAFSKEAEAGKFRGGLGSIQIVRYSDTPAGSYDELLLVPGAFNVLGSQKGRKALRNTRIYVSQKDTCFNGRRNWGIPKHLARFEFSHPPGSTASAGQPLKVEVFPPSDHPSTSKPFFTANLTPFTWAPAVAFSTKAMPYLGVDVHLVQPPLPAGDEGHLPGTDKWLETLPYLWTKSAKGMWVDYKESGEKEGWWPELKPWKVGLWMENTTLEFDVPKALS